MIKNTLLAVVCILMVSCASKQHKAEKLVTDYLDTHLAAPKSYEGVSFGDVDTVFKRYAETKQFDSLRSANIIAKQKADRINDTLMNLISTSKPNYMEALKRQMKYEADTSSLSKTIRSNELLFKGPVRGWKIVHTYRAQDAKGSPIQHSTQFWLDSALTQILSAQDVR